MNKKEGGVDSLQIMRKLKEGKGEEIETMDIKVLGNEGR